MTERTRLCWIELAYVFKWFKLLKVRSQFFLIFLSQFKGKHVTKSFVEFPHGIAATLQTTDSHPRFESLPQWKGKSSPQQLFLSLMQDLLPVLDIFRSEGNLDAIISAEVADVNNMLKERGFDIQLEDLQTPDALYMLSIIRQAVQWKHEGEKETIFCSEEGDSYDGVTLEEGVDFFEAPSHPHGVARIATKDPKKFVFMTIADGFSQSPLGLTGAITCLHHDLVPASRFDFSALSFPMIDANIETDISWCAGLHRGSFSILEALQQTMFQMNHIGAVAETATAMAGLESLGPKTLEIDQPFFLWMTQDGIDIPTFFAFFAQDVWSDPGDVNFD